MSILKTNSCLMQQSLHRICQSINISVERVRENEMVKRERYIVVVEKEEKGKNKTKIEKRLKERSQATNCEHKGKRFSQKTAQILVCAMQVL